MKDTYRRSARDGRKLERLHFVKYFVAAAVVIFLLFRFVIGLSVVSGVSMKNTFFNGDPIVYLRLTGGVQKGDVVSVSLPTGEYYIKRVVATGGDVVDIRDGKLYINGVEETDAHVVGNTYAEESAFNYPYTVAEGDLFILGDNREESIDSRFFGAVNERQITGIIKLRLGWFFIELV